MPAGPSAFQDGGVLGEDGGVDVVDGSIIGRDGQVVIRLGDDPLDLPPQRIWRLTPLQYERSFVAAFGSTEVTADAFGEDSWTYGYRNIAEQNHINVGWALSVHENALATGEKLGDALASERPCLYQASPNDACVRQFVVDYAQPAFRRPVLDAERDAFVSLFRDVRTENAASVAVSAVIRAIAQSPAFLYRTEMGTAGEGSMLSELTQYEIASELSFLMTDAPPDAALWADAEAGMLDDRTVVRAHAERLLRTDAGKDKVGVFFDEYLRTYDLEDGNLGKSVEMFESYTPQVQRALHQETRAFINRLMIDQNGTLKDLFTSDQTYYNDTVAAFYGWESGGDGEKMTQEGRQGVFQQGAFLAASAAPASSSPLHRGLYVYERLLCKHIMPPSDLNLDEVAGQLIPEDPEATAKQGLDWLRETSPQCWGCHNIFVPLGLSLENFDAVGAFRSHQNERVLDPTGELLMGLETDGAYQNGGELFGKIASSAAGQACFAQQWMRFAFGGEFDVPVTAAMVKQFRNAELRIVDLLLAFVEDDAFFVRTVGEDQ